MNGKYMVSFIVMCSLVVGMVIFLNMPLIPSEAHTYTGILISYEPHDLLHGGYLLSSTVLHFDNGASFAVEGAGTYMLGVNYTINYEQAGSVIKVTSVTLTHESSPTIETTFRILLKCYDMENMTITISHDPRIEGGTNILFVQSNYSEIQTYSEFKNGSKVFIAFYWTFNYTMVNSFQMNVWSSYIFQYNQTSRMVQVY